MSDPVRVLLVDDSIVIRSLLRDALGAEEGVEVVGLACDGLEAIQQIHLLKPDVVVLDLMMPLMDGKEVLKSLQESHSGARIIVFSSSVEQAKDGDDPVTIPGADDVLVKPDSGMGLVGAVEYISDILIPKILYLGSLPPKLNGIKSFPVTVDESHHGTEVKEPKVDVSENGLNTARIVAVGASTGGPEAIVQLLDGLPDPLHVPIVIVQHMPVGIGDSLAAQFSKRCRREVRLAKHNDILRPGMIRLAPAGLHTRVADQDHQLLIKLNNDAPVHSCRPAIDQLLASLADAVGSNSHSVILTGMGVDGLAGATKLREAGATVDVQDRSSSAVWGMPRAIFEAGLANRCASLPVLAKRIVERTSFRPRAAVATF